MTTSKTITAATGLPISIEEIKEDLGLYHDEKDYTIQTFLEAAVSFAEKFTGQVFRCPGEVLEQWVSDFAPTELDYSPVTGVVSVKYLDSSGSEVTLPSGSYTVLNAGNPAILEYDGMISAPVTATRGDAVRIRYVAGYPTPAGIPPDVRTAILLTVRHLYESGGNPVKQMPTAAEWLLRNHRVH